VQETIGFFLAVYSVTLHEKAWSYEIR